MNLKLSQILTLEDLAAMKEPTGSPAYQKAKRLGLEYYGFGRYGKDGKLTHFSHGDDLRRYRTSYITKNRNISNNREIAKNLDSYERTKKSDSNFYADPEYYDKKSSSFKDFNDLKKQNPVRYNRLKKLGKGLHDQNVDLEASLNDQKNYIRDLSDKSQDVRMNLVHDDQYDWKPLPDDIRKTLTTWAGSGYRPINKGLASKDFDQYFKTLYGDDDYKQSVNRSFRERDKQKFINNVLILDKLTREKKVPFDMPTFAGVSTKYTKNLKIGKSALIKTFRSTSTDVEKAVSFATGHQVDDSSEPPQLIQFNLKKGDPGWFMDGPNQENNFNGESEIILPRNIKIKITGKRTTHLDTAYDVDEIDSKMPDTIWFAEIEGIEDPEDDMVYQGKSYEELEAERQQQEIQKAKDIETKAAEIQKKYRQDVDLDKPTIKANHVTTLSAEYSHKYYVDVIKNHELDPDKDTSEIMKLYESSPQEYFDVWRTLFSDFDNKKDDISRFLLIPIVHVNESLKKGETPILPHENNLVAGFSKYIEPGSYDPEKDIMFKTVFKILWENEVFHPFMYQALNHVEFYSSNDEHVSKLWKLATKSKYYKKLKEKQRLKQKGK